MSPYHEIPSQQRIFKYELASVPQHQIDNDNCIFFFWPWKFWHRTQVLCLHFSGFFMPIVLSLSLYHIFCNLKILVNKINRVRKFVMEEKRVLGCFTSWNNFLVKPLWAKHRRTRKLKSWDLEQELFYFKDKTRNVSNSCSSYSLYLLTLDHSASFQRFPGAYQWSRQECVCKW